MKVPFNKKQVINYGIPAVILIIGGYFTYRYFTNKKLEEDLLKKLNESEGTGTAKDNKQNENAWSQTYWANLLKEKKVDTAYVMREDIAKKYADEILGANVFIGDAIITVINKLKNKAQLSHVSYYVLKNSKNKKTLLGIVRGVNKKNQDKILLLVKNLPDVG